jgi:hypothetical protein
VFSAQLTAAESAGRVWRVGFRPEPWAWSGWEWATGFPANAAAGAELLRPPDCVHANVEQLPLTDVHDDPVKSACRKRHVGPPVPRCPGFVIPHSDAVATDQGQEDFDFAFCQRLFQPIPPRRFAERRRTQ